MSFERTRQAKKNSDEGILELLDAGMSEDDRLSVSPALPPVPENPVSPLIQAPESGGRSDILSVRSTPSPSPVEPTSSTSLNDPISDGALADGEATPIGEPTPEPFDTDPDDIAEPPANENFMQRRRSNAIRLVETK